MHESPLTCSIQKLSNNSVKKMKKKLIFFYDISVEMNRQNMGKLYHHLYLKKEAKMLTIVIK